MRRRTRIVAYGVALLLIVAGAACAAAISGEAGGVVAIVLIGLGSVGIVGLVFLEVGLSEDRELRLEQLARDRERQRAERADRPKPAKRFRLDRRRGERRRLR
jgi:hypothetical protein